MRITKTIDETRLFLAEKRALGERIGFVPTMGYLHEGHLSLVDIARQQTSCVVMSIFVNPLQFGPGEDFERYPRDMDRDIRLASERSVDLVFAPEVSVLYPEESLTFVEVTKITEGLCGRTRPGHFKGVMTVVAKLFNIIEPDVSVFGQKDAQQIFAIRRMVKDLNFRTALIIGPTVREEDGLAMSSRNLYLSQEERRQALCIYQSLLEAKQLVERGERDAAHIQDKMKEILTRSSDVKIDYISITDTSVLEPLQTIGGEVLIAVAAFVGNIRLIDNIIFRI